MSNNQLIAECGRSLLAIVRKDAPEIYIPFKVASEFTDSPRGEKVLWEASFGRYFVSDKPSLEEALDAIRTMVSNGESA